MGKIPLSQIFRENTEGHRLVAIDTSTKEFRERMARLKERQKEIKTYVAYCHDNMDKLVLR